MLREFSTAHSIVPAHSVALTKSVCYDAQPLPPGDSVQLLTLPALLLVSTGSAQAGELVWDGHYRTRAEFYDSLSVSNTNPSAEGVALTWDHRLRLQPGWLLSDAVSVWSQLDLLPYVRWGDEPAETTDALGNPVASADSQAVAPPTDPDGNVSLLNLRVTRAWAEAQTDVGRFRFGRMPVEWGSGMVWNAGNTTLSEFGDTEDRLQWSHRLGDVYVLGAYSVLDEGLSAEKDDANQLSASVMYRSETVGIGTYNTYVYQPLGPDSRFSRFTGDIWGRAVLGPVTVETEFAANLGGGDLDSGANDVRVASMGAMLDVDIAADRLLLGLGAGVASGDVDPTDNKLKTFTFDRDFNRTLLLFEEPMPILEPVVSNAGNGGRTTDAVVVGNAISNALWLQPRVGYRLRDDLAARLSLFASRAAKRPESSPTGYGLEFDGNLRYEPLEHLSVDLTGALWLPGEVLSTIDDDTWGTGFDRPVTGVRLVGAVEF